MENEGRYDVFFWAVVLFTLALMLVLRVSDNFRNLLSASVAVFALLIWTLREALCRPAFWVYFTICVLGHSVTVWLLLQSIQEKIPLVLIYGGMVAEWLVLSMGLWKIIKPKG